MAVTKNGTFQKKQRGIILQRILYLEKLFFERESKNKAFNFKLSLLGDDVSHSFIASLLLLSNQHIIAKYCSRRDAFC